ncbi:MAG: (2Fe-2S) ferredoxin domain-containing protein [Bacillota bacterium]|jgi:NADP-reducing hydrogenase subunit HndB|nr:(2Fe-2S) ferredoxin domain-containing protein [Bacillota bacterium]MDW7678045.1 (2Fe-2S) ferredoxin domain-containing protein [Bacillota bacterium]
MKSIAELEAIRKKAQEDVKLRYDADHDGIRVVVGMATCGIAAGARPVMMAFVEEVNKRQLKNVVVTQTGCMGSCRLEPMAEVYQGGERVTYVNLTAEDARKIVAEHLVNGHVVEECTIGAHEK